MVIGLGNISSMGVKMSFNYKIEENNGIYSVVEYATEQTIGKFSDKLEARKLLRHLNLGGGFDGWSPSFFMKNFNLSSVDN